VRRLPLTAVLACLLVAACSREAAQASGPNLLLVVLDTTRADHLSAYGHERPTTPTVDALAASGTRFEQAFSQSSLTPVSAASFLSGAWPHRTGVRSLFVVGGETMSADVPSLFGLLRASGRRTAGFVSAKPMGAQYGLDRGFEHYDDDLTETARRFGIERFTDAPQRPAEETTERALEWLAEHGREPFALMLHWFDAHDPSFVPPREWLEPRLSFPVPEDLERTPTPASWPQLYQPAHLVELYDAEIEYMDRELSRVLAALDELGVRDDTLVVVLADHGEAFGEHDFWSHGILYEEQLHVPLVLAGPGVPAGIAPPDVVRLVDLAPTLCQLLRLDAGEAAFDGASLAAHLRAGDAPTSEPAREVPAEVHHAAQDRLRRDTEMYSLRLGRWKYIHRPTRETHELYDLETDPGELTNLYAPEQAVGLALQARLLSSGAVDGEVPSLEGIPPEELERLRALGYL
jgi:arylsulfatase A-like enzyme